MRLIVYLALGLVIFGVLVALTFAGEKI